MRRYTDLPGVKAVARMLLAQDIQPTAHAPVIVSHPFTSSGIVGLREADGNITFGDLMGSPDDLARWQQMVGEQIDGADSAISIFSLLNRSYYMAFIVLLPLSSTTNAAPDIWKASAVGTRIAASLWMSAWKPKCVLTRKLLCKDC